MKGDIQMQKSNKHGFTLIELSIVIVIIGLIVAGIVAGQSLIRQAKVKKMTADISKFKTATSTFWLQYDALPGDMSNASTYWSDCVDGTGGNNCNGNGDGIFDGVSSNAFNTKEGIRAWQHLSLAGLLEGSYASSAYNSWNVTSGVNSPVHPFSNGCYIFMNSSYNRFSSNINRNLIKSNGVTGSNSCDELVISASEAFNIDNKFDDGIINQGKITSSIHHAQCISGGAYNITSNLEQACPLYFRIDQQ